ncbi:MAG: hypothetical protein ACM3TU_00870 [Bacillota bacterium]
MATVINNPNTDTSSGGWGVAIVILAVIVLGLIAFFAFGRGSFMGSGTPQVNIPVNVGGGTGGGAAGGGQ